MLTHLQVRNLAVIERVAVEFGPGLNVVTGETGAGKSIVVDALALLGGARATTEMIRRGDSGLRVSGFFRPRGEAWRAVLERAGLAAGEDELSVRREISRDGPNRVFLNDEPVTLRLLSEVAPSLLRIHAQREELRLASPELQRWLLDRSGGEEARALLGATAEAFDVYRDLAERCRRLLGDERARLERLDLLRFQLSEIDAASVSLGEETALRAEREMLRHAEAFLAGLGGALGNLTDDDGSAGEKVGAARRALEGIAEWEPAVGNWSREIRELAIRIDELSREVRGRLEAVDTDPRRLDEVEDRLAQLERLFRKYGDGSDRVLESRHGIASEINDLTLDEDRREALERQLVEALSAYRETAGELSRARRRWVEGLVDRVHEELADLAMRRAEFSVVLGKTARADSQLVVDGRAIQFGRHGFDDVTFELAANPGEAKGPLAAVASGGELSRTYLALRLAVGAAMESTAPALVFDEVDAGIGGAEAAALGRKLRRLSEEGQVLAVTHLAQVASCAHRHYRVRKRVVGERTVIEMETLDPEARVEEIARMLAGKRVTELSRSHARELLAAAS